MGNIYFEDNSGTGAFCNVLFERLNYAIEKYDWSRKSFSIDNCYFSDCYYGISLDSTNNYI